jgi:hypothetical protein
LQKNKPSSKTESLPLHPATLLIILSKISCKSFFLSLERFKGTPRYVNGKSEIFQPKICANSLASSSSTLIVIKSFYSSSHTYHTFVQKYSTITTNFLPSPQTGIALGNRPEINWCLVALDNFLYENIRNKNKKNMREGVLV